MLFIVLATDKLLHLSLHRMANVQAKSQIYHEKWFEMRIRFEMMQGGGSGSQWNGAETVAWLSEWCMIRDGSKGPEKQAKKFKKGVAMGVGNAYGARPQFRGSLGFAG